MVEKHLAPKKQYSIYLDADREFVETPSQLFKRVLGYSSEAKQESYKIDKEQKDDVVEFLPILKIGIAYLTNTQKALLKKEDQVDFVSENIDYTFSLPKPSVSFLPNNWGVRKMNLHNIPYLSLIHI